MQLSVRHRTTYKFDAPKRFVTQSHRLTPAPSAAQNILEWQVSADGALFGAGFTDGAGNLVSTMTIEGPVDQVEIVVSGLVETTDTAGVLRGHSEIISPRLYLDGTPLTAESVAFQELLESALAGVDPAEHLKRAHGLSEAVTGAIRYVPGSTDALSTAAEALEKGEGVCQDQAHALIVLAHLDGMPARYVTGYLLSGSDGSAEEASHGWAEIYIGGLGWVGFDPANETCPDERYIRLASGRDSVDAAPIVGVSRGGGAEALDVSVEIAQQ